MAESPVEKRRSNPIPRGWNKAKISEVADLFDSLHKTPKYSDKGYPMVRVADVRNGYLDLRNTQHVTEEDFLEFVSKRVPQLGDLVFSRVGTYGQTSFVNTDEPFCLGQNTVLLVPKVNSRFLYYCLQSPFVQKQIEERVGGTSQKTISLESISSLVIPLPPRIIQMKIEVILQAYDDLIENNRHRIRLLERMARALFREWFVHLRFPGHESVEMVDSELGEIAEGWRSSRIGEITEEVRRNVEPAGLPPDTPYVGLAEIPRRSIALSEWGRVEDAGSSKLEFKRNEILFGKIRPYFHKVVVAPTDGVCSGDTIVIRSKPEFFGLALSILSSDEFVAHATASSKGTKMPRADWSVLVDYPIVIPEPTLLKQFDIFVKQIVSLIHRFVFMNRALNRIRDSLLPKLVSGQIDVSNLNVEIPTENREKSKYSDQSTLDQWLDGDDNHGRS